MSTYSYDLVAIGSGPAGQRAAVQAAKLGKRAAVLERSEVLGGVATNTGTVPSKTLRAAVLDLTGAEHSAVYGHAYRVKADVTMEDLFWRARQVMQHERDVVAEQLRRNRVDVLTGTAAFRDPYTLELRDQDETRTVHAARYVIAVGTVPARPPGVEFDGRTVLDSDDMLRLDRVPRNATVVGAGTIGLEYASMLAALGVRVTVVDKRPHILDAVDEEIAEALQYHLRGLGVVFRLGEEVEAVRSGNGHAAVTLLRSGKRIPSDIVLYAAGRQGATDGLALDNAGLEADSRGRIAVAADLRTAQPHIFAAGDVIGFPSLSATSMEQGRLAALAAFDEPAHPAPELFPFGVYTVPEISYVGATERQLTAEAVPYVVGVGRYREVVRAEIAGDRSGLLKLLVHADTRTILGVHIFGTAATELVHVGQTAMAAGLTLDYLVDAVFNVPTFADAYKVAALDAANRLSEIRMAA